MKDKIYPGYGRWLALGSYSIPDEVLEIERDIVRLELIERILGQIDGRNCSAELPTGYDCLGLMRMTAKLCRRAAEHKRREFLRK